MGKTITYENEKDFGHYHITSALCSVRVLQIRKWVDEVSKEYRYTRQIRQSYGDRKKSLYE